MKMVYALSLRFLYEISTLSCHRNCAGLSIQIFSFNLVQIGHTYLLSSLTFLVALASKIAGFGFENAGHEPIPE